MDHRVRDDLPALSFNPLKREADAFRLLIAVAVVVGVLTALILVGRAIL